MTKTAMEDVKRYVLVDWPAEDTYMGLAANDLEDLDDVYVEATDYEALAQAYIDKCAGVEREKEEAIYSYMETVIEFMRAFDCDADSVEQEFHPPLPPQATGEPSPEEG